MQVLQVNSRMIVLRKQHQQGEPPATVAEQASAEPREDMQQQGASAPAAPAPKRKRTATKRKAK